MGGSRRAAVVAVGVGALVAASAVPAGGAPVSLDVQVAMNGYSWDLTNDGGWDDSTPPECDEAPALSVEDARTPSSGDAFDIAYLVTVAGQPVVAPDNLLDRTTDGADEVLTSEPTSLSGLDVSVQFRVFSGGDVLRQVVTLTNPGATDVAAPVALLHNWGSDSGTEVHATESGDQVIDATDRWVITADGNPAGDPINTSVLSGPGDVVLPPSSVVPTTLFDCAGQEGLTATFDVSVPAGATRHLVFFGRISDPTEGGGEDTGGPDEINAGPNDEALDNLARVYGPMTTDSALWAGIGAADQALVLNWAAQVPEPTSTSTTATTAPSSSTTATTAGPTTSTTAPAVRAQAVQAQPGYTG